MGRGQDRKQNSDDSKNNQKPIEISESSKGRLTGCSEVVVKHPPAQSPPAVYMSTTITDSMGKVTLGINRSLISIFRKMEPDALLAAKQEALLPIVPERDYSLAVTIEDLYPPHSAIPIAERPSWQTTDSKDQVEEREYSYFQSYLQSIYQRYPVGALSFFEHNLHVWQQLWRVVEMSDVVLYTVDARHPLLHFSQSLFESIRRRKGRMILVLTKTDLIPVSLVEAWKVYLEERFPGLLVVGTSIYDEADRSAISTGKQRQRRRRRKRYAFASGVMDLLKTIQSIAPQKQDIVVDWDRVHGSFISKRKDIAATVAEKQRHREQSWNHDDLRSDDSELITYVDDTSEDEESEAMDKERRDDEVAPLEDSFRSESSTAPFGSISTAREFKRHSQLLTIGTIGHPNTGKSSLINSLVTKKVVSTSATPGHTKHYQTIHISPQVRLCDCPGLVFPALLPKCVQILYGMYPIAQVQEPYSSIAFLAARIDLLAALSLPRQRGDGVPWSAWLICEAFAEIRGFFTPRGRPDVYRAANLLLRWVADGKIVMAYHPPGYVWQEDEVNNDAEGSFLSRAGDAAGFPEGMVSSGMRQRRRKQDLRKQRERLHPNDRDTHEPISLADDDHSRKKNARIGREWTAFAALASDVEA